MSSILILIGLVIGVFLPLQAGVNVRLGQFAGHPAIAALISFLIGTVVLVFVSLGIRPPWPDLFSRLGEAPWWAWLGGVLGANYVLMAIILAPRLGAATLIALTVTGQMVSSIVIDHYGILGYPVHPISLVRIAGAALLVVGVLLIQRV